MYIYIYIIIVGIRFCFFRNFGLIVFTYRTKIHIGKLFVKRFAYIRESQSENRLRGALR